MTESRSLQIGIQINKNFKDFMNQAEIAREVKLILTDYARAVRKEAQVRVPKVTHNLEQNIMMEPEEDYVKVYSHVKYSKWVEPEPLGVPMKRRMTRTPFLLISALNLKDKYNKRIIVMLHTKLIKR